MTSKDNTGRVNSNTSRRHSVGTGKGPKNERSTTIKEALDSSPSPGMQATVAQRQSLVNRVNNIEQRDAASHDRILVETSHGRLREQREASCAPDRAMVIGNNCRRYEQRDDAPKDDVVNKEYKDMIHYTKAELMMMPQEKVVELFLTLASGREEATIVRTNHGKLFVQGRLSIESNGSGGSSAESEYESVGEGGFGKVVRAVGSLDRKELAIKTIVIGGSDREELFKGLQRIKYELRIHASLPKHDNLVGYHTSDLVQRILSGGKYEVQAHIRTEYCNEGDLQNFLENPDKQSLDSCRLRQAFIFFRQISCGLQAMHDMRVLHRDIKPSNVLLTSQSGEWQAKLGDFGLSCNMGDPFQSAFSPFFACPQQERGEIPAPSHDVRSKTMFSALAWLVPVP